MARRRRSPEEIERREKLYELLQSVQADKVGDLNSLFKDMISIVLENGLEAELQRFLNDNIHFLYTIHEHLALKHQDELC